MVKNKPLVYVVVPVYNGKKHTDKFLNTFKKQNYSNFKVVIIDDGSNDGTAQMINKNHSSTILITGNGDLWWSGATNLGIERAIKDGADYVLTINNDVTVSNGYIKKLLKAAQNNPNSLVGSIIVYDSDHKKVWYAGAYFDKKRGEMQHVNGDITDFDDKYYKTDWMAGMGVLVPIDVYKKVGFYDEVNFPQYFGDADFSVRALRYGYKLLISSECVFYSDVSSSWVQKQLKTPKPRMLIDLLFSIRSPYQIRTRVKFYRLYWGRWWPLIALKYYLWTIKGTYIRFILAQFRYNHL
jgi:GT2 family glycosyltransferase